MQKVYIYKTKDGTSFDFRKDALAHERTAVLKDVLGNVAMTDDTREKMIAVIVTKFDDIVEAFESAEVMNADEDD